MAQETVSGTVSSSSDPTHMFQGDEVLKVSAVNASLMDAPSISLGEQKISLKHGQSFPIHFQFTYNKSGAGSSHGGLVMQARIEDKNEHLLYINDTSIPLVENVHINVVEVE